MTSSHLQNVHLFNDSLTPLESKTPPWEQRPPAWPLRMHNKPLWELENGSAPPPLRWSQLLRHRLGQRSSPCVQPPTSSLSGPFLPKAKASQPQEAPWTLLPYCGLVATAPRIVMLRNTSSYARLTVKPNKPKHRSLEQRKVYCRAMQEDRWLMPPKPRTSQRVSAKHF